MEYIAEIQAELNGYPGMEKLIFKQGDQNERYVVVTLLKNGVPVQVGTDVIPRVSMTKPDGRQVLVDDNIQRLDDGTLKIKVTTQMATAAGRGLLEIGLYKQDSLLSTSVIDILIYPGALSMVKVASSDEYQALIDALGQIAPAIDAEKERIKNEAVRQQNEALRQEALKLCKNMTEYAEEQGDYAKLQGAYAEKWGKYAEEQGIQIVNDFEQIKEIILSTENGTLLQEIKDLLSDMYRMATDADIDNIVNGTYIDEDDEGSLFEAGTNEDIDDIIGGIYVEGEEPEAAAEEEITVIVENSFKEV